MRPNTSRLIARSSYAGARNALATVRRAPNADRQGERAVGGDQGALGLVASPDQLEQHVGVAVGEGEIADLVDDQERGDGVLAEAPAQGRGAVDRRQISEQLAGAGEQGRVALQDRLVGDVAGDGGLPTPLGPTTTALPASLRKSRAMRASMAARSQRVGHDRSKSARGLKRPILASFSRRSRLRRARSVSSQSSRLAAQPETWASAQWARRPQARRRSARWRKPSAVDIQLWRFLRPGLSVASDLGFGVGASRPPKTNVRVNGKNGDLPDRQRTS